VREDFAQIAASDPACASRTPINDQITSSSRLSGELTDNTRVRMQYSDHFPTFQLSCFVTVPEAIGNDRPLATGIIRL
jgi:hypothetical protein